MPERERIIQQFPFPSAVRRDTAVPIYASNTERIEPHIKYNLSEGGHMYGGPEYLYSNLDRIRARGRERRALESYTAETTEQAEDFLYKWYGLDKKNAHIVMGNRGSYGILMDTFFNVVKAPSQGTVRILDVGVDFPAAYKASQRYDVGPPSGNESPKFPQKMPFYSISLDINATMVQSIDEANRTVHRFGRNRMEGFVVIISIPNSPKGENLKPEYEHKIEDLAYLTATAGYLLIIDEAFKPIKSPQDSLARLVTQYPNIIVTGSASKIIGIPGAGVGWGIMSSELKESWEGTRIEMDMRAPETQVALALLDPDHEEDLRRHIIDVTSKIEDVKQYFVEKLQEGGIEIAPTSNDIPIFLAKGRDENFCSMLNRRGVRVASGSAFAHTHVSPRSIGLGNPAGYEKITGQYARVTVPATKEDVNKLLPLFIFPDNQDLKAFGLV